MHSRGRQRNHPAGLAAALVTDAPEPRSGEPRRLFQCGDRVPCKDVKILRVGAAGNACPALVVDEHANALRRKGALHRIIIER